MVGAETAHATGAGTNAARPIGNGARLLWPLAILLAGLPFLFCAIPPLIDLPGHIGRFAIQTMAPESPLHRYFAFHWAFRLNLGSDLIVEALAPLTGVIRAAWIACLATAMLGAAAIVLLVRAANREGAAGTGWALCLVYSAPFLYGFLNYALAAALALLAFAGWIALRARPALRGALFWLVIPPLLICHLIGGGLLPILIAADAAGRMIDAPRGQRARILAGLHPLLAVIPPLIAWRLTAGPPSDYGTFFNLPGKASALLFLLRDQSRWFDIASVAGIATVLIAGRLLGARYGRPRGAVVLALGLLPLVLPGEIVGASAVDSRLLPPFLIAALVLQDWSRVDPRKTRAVLIAGLALFAARIAVTTLGFARYARSYAAETAALPHIAPGSAVLAFVTRQCRPSRNWRLDRLDHLPALATAERAAWTNAHWDVGDLHLLTIRFRPSPDFYHDPSHYVWPEECTHRDEPLLTAVDRRNRRRTIGEVMPALPLGRVDYLWLVQTSLPPGPWQARLQPVWQGDGSALYRVRRP